MCSQSFGSEDDNVVTQRLSARFMPSTLPVCGHEYLPMVGPKLRKPCDRRVVARCVDSRHALMRVHLPRRQHQPVQFIGSRDPRRRCWQTRSLPTLIDHAAKCLEAQSSALIRTYFTRGEHCNQSTSPRCFDRMLTVSFTAATISYDSL